MKTPQTHPNEYSRAYNIITAIVVKQNKYLPFNLIYGDGTKYLPLNKKEVSCLYETMQEVVKIK